MSENIAQAEINQLYQLGRAAFERGDYRASVQFLERVDALVSRNSRLGGEVQMWLVTAYEATGQISEAIALCRSLNTHPSWETRKQSRRLLYILEAPRLVTRPEWLTQIPDLGNLEGNPDNLQVVNVQPKKRPKAKPETSKFIQLEPEAIDVGQMNRHERQFMEVALILVVLMVASLIVINF